MSRVANSEDLVMWTLCVLPGQLREGIGGLLLDALLALSGLCGRSLVTERVAANSPTGRFYAAHGLEVATDATKPLGSAWMRSATGP